MARKIYYCDYIVCRLLDWCLLGSVLIDAAVTSFVGAQSLVSDIRKLLLCHLAMRWIALLPFFWLMDFIAY